MSADNLKRVNEREIARQRSRQPTNLRIDKDSLTAFVKMSPDIKGMDERLSQATGIRIESGATYIDHYLPRLAYVKIDTIDEVEKQLRERAALVERFVVAWFKGAGAQRALSSEGIAISFLCMSIVLEEGGREALIKFLEMSRFRRSFSPVDLADGLCEAYEEASGRVVLGKEHKTVQPRPRHIGAIILTGLSGFSFVVSGFAGHWMEWWVKLLIASFIAAGSFWFGEWVYDKHGKSVGIFGAILAGMMLAITGGAIEWGVYWRAARSTQETPRRVWQSPELPMACDEIYVMTGGMIFTCSVDNASISRGCTAVIDAGKSDITIRPFVKNNRAYLQAPLPGGTDKNKSIVVFSNDLLQRLPPTWQNNFDQYGLEIVDANLRPLLQIQYMQPNSISVYGMFWSPSGLWVISPGGQEQWEGEYHRCLFRYPSNVYPGVRAQ